VEIGKSYNQKQLSIKTKQSFEWKLRKKEFSGILTDLRNQQAKMRLPSGQRIVDTTFEPIATPLQSLKKLKIKLEIFFFVVLLTEARNRGKRVKRRNEAKI
jgi:hypothetical protein